MLRIKDCKIGQVVFTTYWNGRDTPVIMGHTFAGTYKHPTHGEVLNFKDQGWEQEKYAYASVEEARAGLYEQADRIRQRAVKWCEAGAMDVATIDTRYVKAKGMGISMNSGEVVPTY